MTKEEQSDNVHDVQDEQPADQTNVPDGVLFLTIKEAGKKLGKGTGTLRRNIQRGYVKAVKGKDGKWLIPIKDTGDVAPDVQDEVAPDDRHDVLDVVRHYEKQLTDQRKSWETERDQLRDGLMMYRFQFEELARRLKALPVPPELVAERLRRQEEELAQEQKARAETESQLEAEKKRSWWKKLFNLK